MSPETHKSIAAAQSPELPLASGSCDPAAGEGENLPMVFPSLHERRKMRSQSAEGKVIAAECREPEPHRQTQTETSAGVEAHGGAVSGIAPLAGLGPGGSLEAVLQRRLEQIQRGHTPQSDAGKHPRELLSLIDAWLADAHRAWPVARSQQDEKELRFCLIEIAALAIAGIDRMDFITASDSAAVGDTSNAAHGRPIEEDNQNAD